jgi:hypothetical protein
MTKRILSLKHLALIYSLSVVVASNFVECTKLNTKKSVVDMTDAEIERIYDQWEVRFVF